MTRKEKSSCKSCGDIKPCPTCGGDCRHDIRGSWPMDAPGRIVPGRPITKRRSTDISGNQWFNECPDAYHDIERRSGKDRRKK
jgi:hypothetical protein